MEEKNIELFSEMIGESGISEDGKGADDGKDQ